MNQPDLFAAPRYIVARDHRDHARPSLEIARTERDAGIQRAINGAGTEWADTAYQFLVAFLKQRTYFKSEDVSNASKLTDMPQPRTDRSWGAIYVKAQKDGLMVQDGTDRSARRHASLCIRWRSLLR